MHALNTQTAKKKKKRKIQITLFNTQSRHPLQIRKLTRQAEVALTILSPEWPEELEEVSIIFVDKRKIARIHEEFMQDPTATDVITFDHGEIYICPAIAEIQRKPFKHTLHQEVLTYIIHGLLHLCGWNDLTAKEFEQMAKRQASVLQTVISS